ncbi:sugar phosphate isomerase/epimerase family protein [Treponema brennaborense]|uniref:Xylose isomerase domain-containing protein TIM barrel n=1 Tax=Treponema brennaborense (strain DSM 12168 / CIP 105900 / DD5/3) TaxID=906968 RepID=F4LNI5_TREBD|nr:sugar phosphate isomerase/epimerase [Treponema brennaborense]AEE15839.1 Xylose isomerase domain-containing protein TIM barrel [Treponema brennaborense DSM 12168]
MKICVRAHDLGKMSASALAAAAADYGFDGVQLVLGKAIEGQTGAPGSVTASFAQSVRETFASGGVEIAMLGAYFNPVHSNKSLVASNIEKFREHLRFAPLFGSRFVGSETGSFNDDKWTYHPQNRTPEAFAEVSRIFGDLAVSAKQYGSNLALEGAWGHCCWNPGTLRRLVDSIDNGHVYVTVDVYNYLYEGNYARHTEIFDECLDLFGSKIVIFHLKDFVVAGGALRQVGLGQGIMDWEYMIPRIAERCPGAYLIFEGVPPLNMRSSYAHISRLLGTLL